MPPPYNGARGASARLHNVFAHVSGSSSLSYTSSSTMTTTRDLPKFDDLPTFKEFSGCAWEVWGKDDELGTVNLLTPEVVKEAAKEIKYVLAFWDRVRSTDAIWLHIA